MHSVKIVCLLLLLLYNESTGQQIPNTPPPIISPSPNAAAFQRYGAIPVNYYNGLTQISVPLFDVKSKDISFPIDLSYHASGIKVDDEASKVGLGWTLNASGVISRSIVGGDDFIDGEIGQLMYHSSTPELVQGSIAQTNPNIQGCNVTLFDQTRNYLQYDAEPDQYYYNLPGGKSGKFTLKRNRDVMLAKAEKIDIKVLGIQGEQWTIKTDDGFLYEFFTAESYHGNELIGQHGQHRTAWYLTRIVSPKGNVVTFNYIPKSNYVKSGGKYREILSVATYGSSLDDNDNPIHNSECDAPSPIREPVHGRQYDNVQLDKITFEGGFIQFLYNGREDVLHDEKLYRMEMYKLRGTSQELLKAIDFEYEYFEGMRGSEIASAVFGVTKRLKLKRVYHKGKDNTGVFDYKFDYYNETDDPQFLPSKVSFAKDHWGYYNGRNTNSSLIPSYTNWQTNHVGMTAIGLMGDERDPSKHGHAKLFTLHKLWYPTGGYTEFLYSPHTFDPARSTLNDGSFFAQAVEVDVVDSRYQDHQITLDGDTPGTTPADFTAAQNSVGILDLTNAVATSGGNVVVDMTTFFLFNNEQTTCNFPGHSLTFSIVAQNGTVVYSANIFSLMADVNPAYCVSDASPYTSPYKGIERKQTFGVPPGKYFFQVTIPPNENLFSIIRPTFKYPVRVSSDGSGESTAQIGGGIRIQAIHNYERPNLDLANPSTVPEVIRFVYDYTGDHNNNGISGTHSFGVRSARPEYSYFEYIDKTIYQGTLNVAWDIRCETLKRNGDGIMGLAAHGSPVSYDQVTVLYGASGENGQTVYTYYNAPPRIFGYTDPAYLNALTTVPRRPPAYPALLDPLNGALQMQRDRKYVSAGEFQDVRLIENDYVNVHDFNSRIVWGVEKRLVSSGDEVDCKYMTLVYPVHQFSWINLKQTKETLHDQVSSLKQVKIQNFKYGASHYQVTEVEDVQPGKTIIKTFKYPADYSDAVATPELKQMRGDLHMHSTVVESKTVQRVGAAETVLAHDIQLFKANSGTILPSSSASLVTDKPQSVTGFPQYVPLNGLDTLKYKTNFILEYNPNNDVKSSRKPRNIISSYQWGYEGAYVTAEIFNCLPKDAFYTSFEEIGEGNSADAKTGSRSQTGGYAKALTNLTPGKYTLTYWQKNSDWQLISTQVTVGPDLSYSINLSGHVDEVRFAPAYAWMKTYTYRPLVGLHEAIDENNRVTCFEYDPFNRLEIIRDNQKNIVKQLKYYYRQK